jgi:hypothetical protein
VKNEKRILTKVRKALDAPIKDYAHQCHVASLRIVDGVDFDCRVARGFCEGVGSQHSWVVLGLDCYDRKAAIIDPTLWSYDSTVKGIWTGTMEDGRHTPHGTGSIWTWGRPVSGGGEPIELEPTQPFSDDALLFLEMLGPLDRTGWARLANAPVEEWPAAEILPAINNTVGPLVPIDIIGMLTDHNPGGLYLPGPEKEPVSA